MDDADGNEMSLNPVPARACWTSIPDCILVRALQDVTNEALRAGGNSLLNSLCEVLPLTQELADADASGVKDSRPFDSVTFLCGPLRRQHDFNDQDYRRWEGIATKLLPGEMSAPEEKWAPEQHREYLQVSQWRVDITKMVFKAWRTWRIPRPEITDMCGDDGGIVEGTWAPGGGVQGGELDCSTCAISRWSASQWIRANRPTTLQGAEALVVLKVAPYPWAKRCFATVREYCASPDGFSVAVMHNGALLLLDAVPLRAGPPFLQANNDILRWELTKAALELRGWRQVSCGRKKKEREGVELWVLRGAEATQLRRPIAEAAPAKRSEPDDFPAPNVAREVEQVMRVAAEHGLPNAAVHGAHQEAVLGERQRFCGHHAELRPADAPFHTELARSTHEVQAADSELAQAVHDEQLIQLEQSGTSASHESGTSASRKRPAADTMEANVDLNAEANARLSREGAAYAAAYQSLRVSAEEQGLSLHDVPADHYCLYSSLLHAFAKQLPATHPACLDATVHMQTRHPARSLLDAIATFMEANDHNLGCLWEFDPRELERADTVATLGDLIIQHADDTAFPRGGERTVAAVLQQMRSKATKPWGTELILAYFIPSMYDVEVRVLHVEADGTLPSRSTYAMPVRHLDLHVNAACAFIHTSPLSYTHMHTSAYTHMPQESNHLRQTRSEKTPFVTIAAVREVHFCSTVSNGTETDPDDVTDE